jgi:RNA polymerase-interacting CarD/CdnL/TRCF family regulator
MQLGVGDLVVYGQHGAGPITAREVRVVLGEEQEVVVIALAHGLSVELPLARAEELLRPVADPDEIARLGVILRSEAVLDADSWLKRQRTARANLGTAAGLAQVISQGAQRPSLSPGERDLVRRAKDLLATEIALSRREDAGVASAWIDDQVAFFVRD